MKSTSTLIDFSIVIPAYNEGANILALCKEIAEAMNKLSGKKEVIFIDDGSKDNTWEIIKKAKDKMSFIRGVKYKRNYGKSAALQTGFAMARGRVIITLDADLQDDPKEIVKLVNEIEQGKDVVTGWRVDRRDSLSKKISSKLFNGMVMIATGIQIHDLNCGLKAYKREVLQSVELIGGMHRFLPLLAAWQGFDVGEVPVHHRPRLFGESKYGWERAVKGFLDLSTIIFLHKYAKRPLRFFGTWGIVLFMSGFVSGVYLTWLRLSGQRIGDRPLLNFAVLAMILGSQFFSLGLLGEMIASQRRKTTPMEMEGI